MLANLFRHKGQIINIGQLHDCLILTKTLLDHDDSEVNGKLDHIIRSSVDSQLLNTTGLFWEAQ